MTPLQKLRHHVSGAIERGEAIAIVEQPTPYVALVRVANMILETATIETPKTLIDAAENALRLCGELKNNA